MAIADSPGGRMPEAAAWLCTMTGRVDSEGRGVPMKNESGGAGAVAGGVVVPVGIPPKIDVGGTIGLPLPAPRRAPSDGNGGLMLGIALYDGCAVVRLMVVC